MHVLAFSMLLAVMTQATTPDNSDLQKKLDACVIGVTSMDALVAAFGPPSNQKKGKTWHINGKARRLEEAFYPAVGLTFSLLGNPSELYEIRVENPALSLAGVKVGSPLESVIKALGEGSWQTTKGAPTFQLDYQKQGLTFEFERDRSAPQFPMKLSAPPVVVRMVRYNGRIQFSGK